jgi:hypothetical protein
MRDESRDGGLGSLRRCATKKSWGWMGYWLTIWLYLNKSEDMVHGASHTSWHTMQGWSEYSDFRRKWGDVMAGLSNDSHSTTYGTIRSSSTWSSRPKSECIQRFLLEIEYSLYTRRIFLSLNLFQYNTFMRLQEQTLQKECNCIYSPFISVCKIKGVTWANKPTPSYYNILGLWGDFWCVLRHALVEPWGV